MSQAAERRRPVATPNGSRPGLRTRPLSQSRSRAWRRLERFGPEAATIAVAGLFWQWRVGAPSAWWDEATTRDVVSRPLTAILHLARNVDLVHLPYYLLAHLLTGNDPTFFRLRLISVVAMALTAGVLVRLGRELGSVAVGLASGLLLTTAPLATRYAQEARPYALACFMTSAAALALVRAFRRPWLRRRWWLYGGLLVGCVLVNLLSVTVLLGHAVYAAYEGEGAVRRAWARTSLAAAAVVSPFALGVAAQRGQLAWLPAPRLHDLTAFLNAEWDAGWVVAGLVVIAVAGAWYPPFRLRISGGTHRPALVLGLGWGLLPPLALWSVSHVQPLYDWRYVLVSLPGLALALGSLATLARPIGFLVPVVALALLGVHMQHVYRAPSYGHSEDMRGTARVIARQARPGDAVLFLPASRRLVALAYPSQFRGLDDVALVTSPSDSATIWGVESAPGTLAGRLDGHARVWLVSGPPRLGEVPDTADREKARLLVSGYVMQDPTITRGYSITLFVRPVPPDAR